MALAATQAYRGSLDVKWNQKEHDEQQIVANFIFRALKKNVHTLKVSETQSVRAGNLVHLQTKLYGTLISKLKEVNLELLINSLHPTPAVCGLPKAQAQEFILTHENYNREFYTGFLGELNFETKIEPRSSKRNIENKEYAVTKKTTQLFVNLRCMQWQEHKAILYVGGGITKDSIPEDEWNETVSKSLIIKNML